jgi:hypothetical protein
VGEHAVLTPAAGLRMLQLWSLNVRAMPTPFVGEIRQQLPWAPRCPCVEPSAADGPAHSSGRPDTGREMPVPLARTR